MKRILALIMIIQGVLVSSVLVRDVNVNGVLVPVIYEKNSALPIVSFQLIVQNAGSMYDGSLAGLAKFSAAMLGEGTLSKGSIAFATALENRAIDLHVSAGSETFVFEILSLKEDFSFALSMLKELLSEPNFSDESFAKIKQLTLGNLSSKQSDFDYVASLNLKKEIFKATPFGHAFGGEEESIGELKLADIQKFYKDYIDLDNALVVIGGDIEEAEIVSALQKLLNTMQRGSKRELRSYNVSGDAKDMLVYKDTQQAYIYFGAPYDLSATDKNTHISKVAGFILGESGFGSRLMEEIRVKRGLAYSAYSRFHLNRSHSYLSGYLQTKLESLDEAKAIVKSEIARFVKDGVTQDELDQAKRFLLGSEPLRNETLSQRLTRAFSEYYRGYELGFSLKQLELIEKLTLKELNNFIAAHAEIQNLTFSVVTKKID
ncbi:MAG: insulinase family protein [Sulfurospirillum sp.]|nr:insulinase family protein [Sulfurospirillum sp.]